MNVLRDVMFKGLGYATLVPQLSDLFLQREQDPVQCVLKGYDGHGSVQALLEGDATQRIQGRK